MTKFPEDGDGPLLAMLAGYGVISAVIAFDGSGDSGNVEDAQIEMLGSDPEKVEITEEHYKRFTPEASNRTLPAVLEAIAYQMLERNGSDWYNNDGGWGDVRITPGTGEIFVDMNVRITTSEAYPSDFSIEVGDDG
jgi:hypothetical protein